VLACVSKTFNLSTRFVYAISLKYRHCIFLVGRFVCLSNVSQPEVNFWSVRNYLHPSRSIRTLPVGSELAAITNKLTGSSSGVQITRSIVVLSSFLLRSFFNGLALMSWFTRRCSNRARYKRNPLKRHGVMRTTRRYVVFTGVRINTLVPNNTKVGAEEDGTWFSVGSDVPLLPSRWGDYSTDYALFFLQSII